MGYNLDTSSLPPHTILRGRIYYFQLRVPKQHQQPSTLPNKITPE